MDLRRVRQEAGMHTEAKVVILTTQGLESMQRRARRRAYSSKVKTTTNSTQDLAWPGPGQPPSLPVPPSLCASTTRTFFLSFLLECTLLFEDTFPSTSALPPGEPSPRGAPVPLLGQVPHALVGPCVSFLALLATILVHKRV